MWNSNNCWMGSPGLEVFEGLSAPFPPNLRQLPLPSRRSPPSAAGGRGEGSGTHRAHTDACGFSVQGTRPLVKLTSKYPGLGPFPLPLWAEERKRGRGKGQNMGEGGSTFPAIYALNMWADSHPKSILITFLTKIHLQIILSFKYSLILFLMGNPCPWFMIQTIRKVWMENKFPFHPCSPSLFSSKGVCCCYQFLESF